MTLTNYNLNFEKLCATYKLGLLTAAPEQVFGGFLHRMYKMRTDHGEYAVKALNPQIMLREAAMNNTLAAESIAVLARRDGVNALPALRHEQGCMHEVDGQYYLLFPWVQGRSISADAATIAHCRAIGEVLAVIHKADFSALQDKIPKDNAAEMRTDWAGYAGQGQARGLSWSGPLMDNLDQLLRYQELVNTSAAILNNNRVISHRDLDPKNVLWDDRGQPVIIDWEAAGWVHPAQELIEVALYWSEFESGQIRKEAFSALIEAYRLHGGELCCNSWPDVLNSGFQGKLGWLDYSIRRSLGLEGADEAEGKLGESQILPTLQALNDYCEFIPLCLEWLAEID